MSTKDPNECDEDCSDSCSICMEEWTIGAEHQVCVLKCGHLFGRSCIERWIKDQGQAAKCPNCNKPAKKHDIRNVWCKSIRAADSTELRDTKLALDHEVKLRRSESGKLYNCNLKLTMAQQDIDGLKKQLSYYTERCKKLEHTLDGIIKNRSTKGDETSMQDLENLLECTESMEFTEPVRIKGVFHKRERVDCINDGKCTSVSISPSSMLAVVAQPAPPNIRTLFGNYGLRKYSIADFSATEFIPLHLKDISSFDLKRSEDLALTSSDDKRVKITSLTNNTTIQCYETPFIPSCVSWSKSREQQFYVGYANCHVAIFDMRNTSESIYQTKRIANTRLISGTSYGKQDSELKGFIMNDIKGCHFLEMSEASSYDDNMIDLSVEHAYYNPLPFGGKMGTVDYDEKSGLALVSTRVSQLSTNCVDNLIKLNSFVDEDNIRRVEAKTLKTFIGGKSSFQLSQSRILKHPTREDNVLVASYDEESSKMNLWDSSDNSIFQSLVCKRGEIIRDISMISEENDPTHMLFLLGDRSFTMYQWDFA